jgi:hypothetical protein
MRKTVAVECIYSIDHVPIFVLHRNLDGVFRNVTRASGSNLKIHRASGAALGDCDERGNEGKSAVSFCCQVAPLVPDMFLQLVFSENHKIVKNSATTEA